jgi:cysteinyl-tRNA synthetase
MRFRDTKETVHASLADNFNSRSAIAAISELITDLSKEFKASSMAATHSILLDITHWITALLTTFGFPASNAPGRLGWAEDHDDVYLEIKKAVRHRDAVRAKAIAKSKIDEIDVLTHNLDALLTQEPPAMALYLPGIRNFASAISRLVRENAALPEFLKECDRFRDETMCELGVSISDTEFGIATIRFADPSRLVAEQTRKRADESLAAEKKAVEKAKRKEEEERKAREKLERGKVSPEEMFQTAEYSQWDEAVITPFFPLKFWSPLLVFVVRWRQKLILFREYRRMM